MAIVKIINYKQSGMREMAHNIAYGCNPAKKGSLKKDVVYGIASSPEKSFVVNKWLNGKLGCKRLFKSGVVSMEATWSDELEEFCMYEKKMYQLAEYIASWWWDNGFQNVSSVHCNTKHPHIHFSIDTCSVKDGKQLSQGKNMLKVFKEDISQKLDWLGFGEQVVGSPQSVAVEELEAVDEGDYYHELFEEQDKIPEDCIIHSKNEIGGSSWMGNANLAVSPDNMRIMAGFVQQQQIMKIMAEKVDTRLRPMARIVK